MCVTVNVVNFNNNSNNISLQL